MKTTLKRIEVLRAIASIMYYHHFWKFLKLLCNAAPKRPNRGLNDSLRFRISGDEKLLKMAKCNPVAENSKREKGQKAYRVQGNVEMNLKQTFGVQLTTEWTEARRELWCIKW